jgi:hypothetical protein
MAEAEDMTVTGTADMTMIGGEKDMTVIGTADITMTVIEEDMTVTGTADLTMAGIEGTTKKDNSRLSTDIIALFWFIRQTSTLLQLRFA